MSSGITRVGWIGLGKLGLPCALTMETLAAGRVRIVGYDTNPRVAEAVATRSAPWTHEHDVDKLLEISNLGMVDSVSAVLEVTDGIVFCAVQTPHDPAYGGEAPMPATTADFDYTALRAVASAVNAAALALDRRIILVVISTALPGTMRREIAPLVDSSRVRLVYNPFFIAMGTTVSDFSDPEFVLLGANDEAARAELVGFYRRLYGDNPVPIVEMGLDEAELTKVAYNTYVSQKIVFANTMLELCEDLGLNVDKITDALSWAHRRLISPAYLRGGVGDGGACHPRDNIAMAWLAEKTGLYADPFTFVTVARERQSQWLADLVTAEAIRRGLPIVVLGKAYKPESELTYGSQAALLVHQLDASGVEVDAWWDPYVDEGSGPFDRIAVFVVMTAHAHFATARYLPGSVVVDPFRYVEHRDGVSLRRLGERRGVRR